MQAPAGGAPGVRTQGRKGDDGSHKACRPPCRGTGAAPRACAVLASCLRHACNEGKTTSPPPPHTPPPPQGWGMKAGRGGHRPPPPPDDKAARWEAAERGCGTDHTTVPVGSTRRASPTGGGHRGCERRVGRATTGATRQAPPPPPAEGQVPRLVPAPCLRRAYARGRTTRTPPPHPLLPHPPRKGARTARRRRGDMGGGGGRGQTDAPGGETGGGRWRRKKKKQRPKQTNAPGEESEEAGTNTAT